MPVETAAPEDLVAVFAALPEESGPLLRRLARRRRISVSVAGARAWRGLLAGHDVILCRTGAGASAARKAAAAIFSDFAPRRWIGLGLAGALSPELSAGAVLVADRIVDERGCRVESFDSDAVLRWLASCPAAIPSRLVRVDRIAATPKEKTRLRLALGDGLPAAADMESAGWAAAARESGDICGVVVRTVSDTAFEEIPAFVAASVSKSGRIDRGRIARHALRHPSTVGKLLALRRRAISCAERLAACVEKFAERGF